MKSVMKKIILKSLVATLSVLWPLWSQAYMGLHCDPDAHFCVFVQGDSSLKTKVKVKTSLQVTINRTVFEYPDEIQLSANIIKVAGLPSQFMGDAKIRTLAFKIQSINNQPLSNCQITTPANQVIQPAFHLITLSETLENGSTQYGCVVQ
jgi:hypothetical protein